MISNSPTRHRYCSVGAESHHRCNDSDDLAEQIDATGWSIPRSERPAAAYSGYARQFDFDRCMDAMEGMLLNAVQGACHG